MLRSIYVTITCVIFMLIVGSFCNTFQGYASIELLPPPLFLKGQLM